MHFVSWRPLSWRLLSPAPIRARPLWDFSPCKSSLTVGLGIPFTSLPVLVSLCSQSKGPLFLPSCLLLEKYHLGYRCVKSKFFESLTFEMIIFEPPTGLIAWLGKQCKVKNYFHWEIWHHVCIFNLSLLFWFLFLPRYPCCFSYKSFEEILFFLFSKISLKIFLKIKFHGNVSLWGWYYYYSWSCTFYGFFQCEISWPFVLGNVILLFL